MTGAYFALVVAAWVIYFGLALGATALLFGKSWPRMVGITYLLVLFLLGCITIMPFDKFFEERFRRLQPVKNGHIAEPDAAPNVGPAASSRSSEPSKGLPSVS